MATPVRDAATQLAALLDTPFLRALAEPARLEVLKVLLVHGDGDVAALASHLPQDRSVVSRHLQTLEAAGVLRSSRDGRRRIYALDGSELVGRFEVLSTRLRALAAICCPPTPRQAPHARRSRRSAARRATPRRG